LAYHPWEAVEGEGGDAGLYYRTITQCLEMHPVYDSLPDLMSDFDHDLGRANPNGIGPDRDRGLPGVEATEAIKLLMSTFGSE
jgi:hypothetical protein